MTRGQKHSAQWQSSMHARSKLGPLVAPTLCPGSCCWPGHPSQASSVAPRPKEAVAAAGHGQPTQDSQAPG